MTLTHENYYTGENTCISNSKVSDFFKSKEYYYKRYVSREIVPPLTVPIKVGKIVDAILSGEPIPYQVKVLKRENPELYGIQQALPDDNFVTEAQYHEALQRAQAVTREPFFQWYGKKKAEFQVILQSELTASDGETMIPVCGMADVITKDKGTIYIDDFKSVAWAKCKTAKNWYWNCQSMGYFRQMAAYQMMAEQKYPKAENIVCRHVVVSKEAEHLYRVKLFVLPQFALDRGKDDFVYGVQAIAAETEFLDDPITWNQAEYLREPDTDGIDYVDADDE